MVGDRGRAWGEGNYANVVNPPQSQMAVVANVPPPVNTVAAVNPVPAANPAPAVTTVNRGRGRGRGVRRGVVNRAKVATQITAADKAAADDIALALAAAKDDGWEVGVLKKPQRLKFTGVEKVNCATKPADATQYFELLFDNELIDNVIKFTNAKAVKLASSSSKRRSPLHNFKPVTPDEFRQFLG